MAAQIARRNGCFERCSGRGVVPALRAGFPAARAPLVTTGRKGPTESRVS